jgi:hypothetical protein
MARVDVQTGRRLAAGILIGLLLAMLLSAVAPRVAAAADPVIAAAGDIACDPGNSSFNGGAGSSGSCRQLYTSNLLVNQGLSGVLLLGDNQYYCGGYAAFQGSYDLSWGRVKSITFPSVGNHEYLTSGGTGCDSSNTGAAGYFRYFGAAAGNSGQGYYSYDIGSWHLIALNSQCSQAGGCSAGSAQGKWLQADLASHAGRCILAYWHIPLFSSGGRASANSRPFWDALYGAGADVVLNGHDHIYERFAPQTPTGAVDSARGIREFIAGTGGANHTSLAAIAANSQLRNTDTFGVLKLTLHPGSYDWRFEPEAGKTFTDSGSQVCHSSGADTTPPTAPTGLKATPVSGTQVDLSWTASSDTVGVAGYKVFRNGTQIATTTTTSYSDTGVAPNTPYSYFVKAYDFGNNDSDPSGTVNLTTPGASTVLTFTPTDDSYAQNDAPANINGASPEIIADNGPVKRLFVKFQVNGVGTKNVLAAKLRLYCVNPSGTGGDFHSASPLWSESSLSWNLQPSMASQTVSSIGAVSSGRWYETDVTPLVTGDGSVSIGATSTSSDGAHYSSKEGPAGFAPQLVVTTG